MIAQCFKLESNINSNKKMSCITTRYKNQEEDLFEK